MLCGRKRLAHEALRPGCVLGWTRKLRISNHDTTRRGRCVCTAGHRTERQDASAGEDVGDGEAVLEHGRVAAVRQHYAPRIRKQPLQTSTCMRLSLTKQMESREALCRRSDECFEHVHQHIPLTHRHYTERTGTGCKLTFLHRREQAVFHGAKDDSRHIDRLDRLLC